MKIKSISLFASAILAYGATPDAGSLNKNIEQQLGQNQGKAIAKPQIQSQKQTDIKADDNSVKFVVNGFKVSGNTVITTAEIDVILQQFKGKKYTFSQLQEAPRAIAEYYQQTGFNARAFFPPQEIKDGIIEVMILEGKLSAIDIDATSSARLRPEIAKGMIEEHHKVGDTLNVKDIEKGLVMVSELPGTKPSSQLASGDNAGETKLKVKLEDTSLATGNVGFANSGSKSTGVYQTSGVMVLNSPSAIGDQLTFQGMKTQGIDYGKVGYSLPVGTSGLKAGISGSVMNYEVVYGTEADGESRTYGLNLSYPLLRAGSTSLDFVLSNEHKSYLNRSSNVVSSEKTNKAYNATVSGTTYDQYGNFGYGLTYTNGQIDLSKVQADYLTDQSTAKANGSFSKLAINLSRTQILADDLTCGITAMAQKAFDNLDSSEKMYLGGVSGIKAYPNSEAGGDEGVLINLELNQRLGYGFNIKGFYDIGQVKQHHNLYNGWQGSSTADNRYMLRGVGSTIGYSSGTWNANTTVAYKQGTNPNASITDGTDNDGTDKNPRLWFSLTKMF